MPQSDTNFRRRNSFPEAQKPPSFGLVMVGGGAKGPEPDRLFLACGGLKGAEALPAKAAETNNPAPPATDGECDIRAELRAK